MTILLHSNSNIRLPAATSAALARGVSLLCASKLATGNFWRTRGSLDDFTLIKNGAKKHLFTPFRLSYHTKSGNLSDKGRSCRSRTNGSPRPRLNCYCLHNTKYTRLIWLLSNNCNPSCAPTPYNCVKHNSQSSPILPMYTRLSPVLNSSQAHHRSSLPHDTTYDLSMPCMFSR